MRFVHRQLDLERDKLKQAAEDICSETWVDFPKAALQFERKSKVKSWLCGMAKDKVLELIRGQPQSREKQLSPGRDGQDP